MENGGAPALGGARHFRWSVRDPFPLVAEEAANRRAADDSDGAAAREKTTRDATGACADRGVPVLCRHTGTTAQAQRQRRNNCISLHRFHLSTSNRKER